MSVPKPHWFSHNHIMVSTAQTCGISKSGGLLAQFDPVTGQKKLETDPETGELMEAVNDCLLKDMEALRDGNDTDTLHFIERKKLNLRLAVPVYYDRRYHQIFTEAMCQDKFLDFKKITLGEMLQGEYIAITNGHGSAPKDLRVGEVPYIKVSDLRAGLVNINPTNKVPLKTAERYWRGLNSGLQPYDLICPERASRNIGDFCVLMPGQERILLTKEVIVLRAGNQATFDQFYLLWAMTLKIVRDQWNRIVFMQTNREDVGKRYLEIEVPFPPNREKADEISDSFRSYFTTLATEREKLRNYLDVSKAHHFFISGADQVVELENI